MEYVIDADGNEFQIDDDGYVVGYTDPNGDYYPVGSPSADAVTVGSSDWVTSVSDMLKAGFGALSSYQLNQINLERAKKGLSPLNTAAYGPQVGVGLNQQTMRFLTYGAIGLGAVLLVTKMAKS